MKTVVSSMFQAIWGLSFLGFIAIKVGGVSLAAWSWWWLLLPQVPCFSLIVKAYGL